MGKELCRHCNLRVPNCRSRGLCGRCYQSSRHLYPLPPREPTLAERFKVCRHCKKANVNRPRGLCWGCYHVPGVKDLYPSDSKYASRGVGNFAGPAPLPAFPTTAAPGTPGKMAALEHRAKLKQALHHPADARYAGDPRPFEWFARVEASCGN